MRRLAAGLVALCAAGGSPLAAQRFWNYSYSPYAYYSTVDGFWLAGYARVYSPVGFEQGPEPYRTSITLTAGASTQGSRVVLLDAQAPKRWPGWRAALTLTAQRANRLGYYGLGNTTAFVEDSITGANPYFYRVSRSTQSARATLQRRVVGPLRLLAGVTVERTSFRGLPGRTVFEDDVAAGVVDTSDLSFTDVATRAGVVFDLRDWETDPHSGILVEALYASGRGYTRRTGSVQAYAHPFEKLMLAGRLAGERMSGDPPLPAQMTMESSHQPFIAVGGYRSLRGYYDGRFVGPGKLLGGVEVRYALLYAPTLAELKLVAFYDVARVFGPGEEVRVTTDGLHDAWGAEVALRIGLNSLVVVGAGFGDEGWQLLFGTNWSY